MSATLHDRIRAAVADERERSLRTSEHQDRRMASLCDHADRILDRHEDADCCVLSFYGACIEVRDLAEAWGVDQ